MNDLNVLKQFSLIIIGMLNLSSFTLFYIDKKRAQFNQRRITEKSLILSAIVLGGIGALLGMATFRHKTKHVKFRIIIPVSAVITMLMIYLILNA